MSLNKAVQWNIENAEGLNKDFKIGLVDEIVWISGSYRLRRVLCVKFKI